MAADNAYRFKARNKLCYKRNGDSMEIVEWLDLPHVGDKRFDNDAFFEAFNRLKADLDDMPQFSGLTGFNDMNWLWQQIPAKAKAGVHLFTVGGILEDLLGSFFDPTKEFLQFHRGMQRNADGVLLAFKVEEEDDDSDPQYDLRGRLFEFMTVGGDPKTLQMSELDPNFTNHVVRKFDFGGVKVLCCFELDGSLPGTEPGIPPKLVEIKSTKVKPCEKRCDVPKLCTYAHWNQGRISNLGSVMRSPIMQFKLTKYWVQSFLSGCTETVIGFFDHDDMQIEVIHVDVVDENDETKRGGFADFMKFMQALPGKCRRLAPASPDGASSDADVPVGPMFHLVKGDGAYGTTLRLGKKKRVKPLEFNDDSDIGVDETEQHEDANPQVSDVLAHAKRKTKKTPKKEDPAAIISRFPRAEPHSRASNGIKASLMRNVRFYDGTVKEEHIPQLKLLHEHLFPVRYRDEFYNDIINGVYQAVLVFAADSNHIIGVATGRVEEKEDACMNIHRIGYIATFGVHRDFRRQGLGSRLLKQIESLLGQTCDEISLHVSCENKAAVALYRCHSYVILERLANHYRFHDDPYGQHDAYLLSKSLQRASWASGCVIL